MQIGALVSAATGCKKAIDTMKAVSKVPDQCEHILSVCSACQPALRLVARLQAREATHAFVDEAAAVASSVFTQCEDAFAQVPEDIAAGESDNRLEAWWNSAPPKKLASNATRLSLLPELQMRVTHALSALQLSLTTVALEIPDVQTRGGWQAVSFSRQALEDARAILHLFEMGRLQRSGNRYPVCAAKLQLASKSAGLRDMGVCSVTLAAKEIGTYELVFVPESGFGDGKPCHVLPLSSALVGDGARRVKRKLREKRELEQSLYPASAMQYHFGTDAVMDFIPLADPWCVVPEYPRGGDERYVRVTVEVFELLVLLCADMSAKAVKAVDALMQPGENAAFEAKFKTAVEDWLTAP